MIRIQIKPSAVAFLCVFYAVDPIGMFWPIVSMAALHEAGHYLALRCSGVPVRQLSLRASGAVMETGSMNYWTEALCAAAGPVVNLLLFFLLRQTHARFALASLGLAAFNLLPVWPLDGGRILRALLLHSFSLEIVQRAERIVCFVLQVSLCAAAAWATCCKHLGLWPALLAGLLLLRTGQAAAQERLGEKFVANRRAYRYNKRIKNSLR